MFDSSPAPGLKEAEERLVEEILSSLDAGKPELSSLVRQRFETLREYGRVIARFPSIREVRSIRNDFLDGESLIGTFRRFSPGSRFLHVPSRITAVRSFLVAKSHSFALLARLVEDNEAYSLAVRKVLFSIIAALMAEEVYSSCLEDPAFPEKVRRRLADDLISLWESGIDPLEVRYLPALEALWATRESTPPVYGTMDGSSEFFRISIDLGPSWDEFIMRWGDNQAIRESLEEFLFGLSYEEIQKVRKGFRRRGGLSVKDEDIRSLLGEAPVYASVKDSDPRAIYDFYIDRRDAAALRRSRNDPGPRETLEQMYLKFQLAQA
ncbi:MAG: hypothetical protein LBT11_04095 [Treponema sp.]|jgi:hypothetical protein|nr:hypothetical protein [Treponema sp.]